MVDELFVIRAQYSVFQIINFSQRVLLEIICDPRCKITIDIGPRNWLWNIVDGQICKTRQRNLRAFLRGCDKSIPRLLQKCFDKMCKELKNASVFPLMLTKCFEVHK